jgi:hypothetical protein
MCPLKQDAGRPLSRFIYHPQTGAHAGIAVKEAGVETATDVSGIEALPVVVIVK